jgi:hypothetical protein
MNVNLHIERLVLEGLPFTSRDAALVREAVQAELARLFDQRDAAAGSFADAALPSMQGTPLRPPATETPPHFGAAIAQSVYGAILK